VTDPAGRDARATPTLRVATYNVHGCRGGDGLLAPERIARVVRELEADVVGLQEIFSGGRVHAASNQLAMLAEATGLLAVAAPASPDTTTGYGNGLLTRWPVVDVAVCDLSVERREPRGAVDAVLRRGGEEIAVVVTHLGLGRSERLRQIRRLLAWLEERPASPRVVAGDLNEWNRWSRAWRFLAQAFDGTEPMRTFPAQRPLFPLDRVLAAPPARVEATTLHVSPLARIASDHLPLVATIRLPSAGPDHHFSPWGRRSTWNDQAERSWWARWK
jgi:endonuclease/exonuclease/phosphatase family metal-dependent hydrolase